MLPDVRRQVLADVDVAEVHLSPRLEESVGETHRAATALDRATEGDEGPSEPAWPRGRRSGEGEPEAVAQLGNSASLLSSFLPGRWTRLPAIANYYVVEKPETKRGAVWPLAVAGASCFSRRGTDAPVRGRTRACTRVHAHTHTRTHMCMHTHD